MCNCSNCNETDRLEDLSKRVDLISGELEINTSVLKFVVSSLLVYAAYRYVSKVTEN